MRYEYIFYEEKRRYCVPRVATMCEARERDALFEKFMGVSPIIISPEDWEILLKRFKIKYLEA